MQGRLQTGTSGLISSRITLVFSFGIWRSRRASIKKRSVQRCSQIISFCVIGHARDQQLVTETLWMILASEQYKNPPHLRFRMDDDLASRRNRVHHLAVKFAAIAIHARVHPIQHFHSNHGPARQDVHFVSIRWIQPRLHVKRQHRPELRMNRLDVRSLPARCSSAHTHGTQKYQAETMHGLGPSFSRN
jgi:hypothetical protein